MGNLSCIKREKRSFRGMINGKKVEEPMVVPVGEKGGGSFKVSWKDRSY